MHKYQNRVLADLTVLQLVRTVWAKMSKTHISTNTQVSYLSWFPRFIVLIRTVWARVLCTISKIVFLADLTVLRLITTVWAKMSQNSYLREFYAQVSQIVFLADLTVLRLITTVWAKISQNSYLQEFCCTSVTNRVLSWFDRFRAYYNCMNKNIIKLISPRVLCTSIKNRVPSWFDRFTAY